MNELGYFAGLKLRLDCEMASSVMIFIEERGYLPELIKAMRRGGDADAALRYLRLRRGGGLRLYPLQSEAVRGIVARRLTERAAIKDDLYPDSEW